MPETRAECPNCGGWNTAFLMADLVRGVQRMECADCRHRFMAPGAIDPRGGGRPSRSRPAPPEGVPKVLK